MPSSYKYASWNANTFGEMQSEEHMEVGKKEPLAILPPVNAVIDEDTISGHACFSNFDSASNASLLTDFLIVFVQNVRSKASNTIVWRIWSAKPTAATINYTFRTAAQYRHKSVRHKQ